MCHSQAAGDHVYRFGAFLYKAWSIQLFLNYENLNTPRIC
jgi:hypothetical protein